MKGEGAGATNLSIQAGALGSRHMPALDPSAWPSWGFPCYWKPEGECVSEGVRLMMSG